MEKKIHVNERRKMVEAMEFIARNLNDEEIFEEWLIDGVADEDIPYGYFGGDDEVDELIDGYIDDEHLSDLMGTFLHMMRRAYKSGGLYCDEVCDDLDN